MRLIEEIEVLLKDITINPQQEENQSFEVAMDSPEGRNSLWMKDIGNDSVPEKE